MNKLTTRDILGVLIALGALVGLVMMFTGEAAVEGNALTNASVLSGLKRYSWGVAILLLGASIGYILIGYDNDVVTASDEDKK